MSRIVPLDPGKAPPESRRAFDEGLAKWGRMTNMKRTLLHSLPAYRALSFFGIRKRSVEQATFE